MFPYVNNLQILELQKTKSTSEDLDGYTSLFTCKARPIHAANMHKVMAIPIRVGSTHISGIYFTMTCNPQWPKIKNGVLSDQSVENGPELAACIFHINACALIAFAKSKKVFWQCQNVLPDYRISEKRASSCALHLL